MYMFLIEDGDRHFNDPVANHMPGLLKAWLAWNPITPKWNDITIGDLAGQMPGLARDFGLANFAPPQGIINLLGPFAQTAFPYLSSNEVPKCGYLRPDGTFELTRISVAMYGASIGLFHCASIEAMKCDSGTLACKAVKLDKLQNRTEYLIL